MTEGHVRAQNSKKGGKYRQGKKKKFRKGTFFNKK